MRGIDAIDGDGVVKSIVAARGAGVKRFILVSVFPEAGRQEGWGESFEHYIAVKKRADVELSRTECVFQPIVITDSRPS